MLDLLRLITTVRVVPRILTALLISIAAAATWPSPSVDSLTQVLVLWPLSGLALYLTFLLTPPDWAHVLTGVLLSGGLAGVALISGLPGSEVLGDPAVIHPAWVGAALIQAAVWWNEGHGWQSLDAIDGVTAVRA